MSPEICHQYNLAGYGPTAPTGLLADRQNGLYWQNIGHSSLFPGGETGHFAYRQPRQLTLLRASGLGYTTE